MAPCVASAWQRAPSHVLARSCRAGTLVCDVCSMRRALQRVEPRRQLPVGSAIRSVGEFLAGRTVRARCGRSFSSEPRDGLVGACEPSAPVAELPAEVFHDRSGKRRSFVSWVAPSGLWKTQGLSGPRLRVAQAGPRRTSVIRVAFERSGGQAGAGAGANVSAWCTSAGLSSRALRRLSTGRASGTAAASAPRWRELRHSIKRARPCARAGHCGAAEGVATCWQGSARWTGRSGIGRADQAVLPRTVVEAHPRSRSLRRSERRAASMGAPCAAAREVLSLSADRWAIRGRNVNRLVVSADVGPPYRASRERRDRRAVRDRRTQAGCGLSGITTGVETLRICAVSGARDIVEPAMRRHRPDLVGGRIGVRDDAREIVGNVEHLDLNASWTLVQLLPKA